MILYNADHHPPAPVLQVTIGSVSNRRLHRTLPALLDTGADITIPESYISTLKLYPVAQLVLEGVDAIGTRVFLYAVRLTIEGIVIPRQEVVITGLDFAVIGRDVLERFNLHLYGPKLAFEINLS